jgi:uncharacterized protein
MKCPNCNETLVMTERQGVEIDYCPKCRGIWLDKGELDKIIEKSMRDQTNFEDDEKDKHNYHDDHTKGNTNPTISAKEGEDSFRTYSNLIN